jgi:dipeptidase
MCTSIMAGKKATEDSLILLSRNEDFSSNNCWNKYMVHRSKPEYANKAVADNDVWTLGTGLQIPIPKNQYAYNAVPDAAGYDEASMPIGNRYFFEERGINEKNFAISATNSLAINEKANEADPLLPSKGIAESIIPTLILPQAESAAHGVKMLGNYIEVYGASEVNGILFGDPKEAWYFENGSAHHWIAVRVPDDQYIAVANGMRVHDVDLNDEKNVLHSKGLYEFVVTNKLIKKPDRHKFNFAEAFGILGNPYNNDRIWLAQKILTPSRKQKPGKQQYPLFLKPDKKITVSDVMGVLRATYEGTILEGKATRPIGVVYTAESHIMTLDATMPKELRGIIWQAISSPLCSPYMPLYSVMDDIPAGYTHGGTQYDTLSSYWAFKGLFALAISSKGNYLKLINERWKEYEEQSIQEINNMNGMLREMYKTNKGATIDFAKRYSTGIAGQTVGMANNERNNLMTKLTEAMISPSV